MVYGVYSGTRQWLQSICSRKLFFFVLLTFQNATAVMLISYTQQRQANETDKFIVTHVVAMQEIMKVLLSFLWCVLDVFRFVRRRRVYWHEENTMMLDKSLEAQRPQTKSIRAKETCVSASDFCRDGDVHSKSGESPGPPLFFISAARQGTWRLFKKYFYAELLHPSALWMLIPAALYTIQNCIFYIALGNFEPALFQVTYQSRILITALLMYCFLHRSFSPRRWMALAFLVVGVTFAQLGVRGPAGAGEPVKTQGTFTGDYKIGAIATAAAAIISSTSSVLMEGLLKSTSRALNSYTSTKNLYLSSYSIVCLAAGGIANNRVGLYAKLKTSSPAEMVRVYFQGFDYLVWTLVLVQAVGGLLVALVIQHSDNIMRTFASVFSIAIGGLCSCYIYSIVPSGLFLFGNFIAISAIVIYSL